MNAQNIQTLLRKLGCNKIRPGPEWIYSSCPLASYTHRKSVDNHPSFSAAVSEGHSGGRCHACNFKGSLLELVWSLQSRSGRDFSDEVEFVRTHDGFSVEQLMVRAEAHLAKIERPVQSFSFDTEIAGLKYVQLPLGIEGSEPGLEKVLAVLPEETLSRFASVDSPHVVEVRDYLVRERGFSLEVLRKWQVCWDERSGRITIPVRDCQGRLVGYSGRSHRAGVTPKYLHAKGFKRDYYLFGEQFLQDNGTGVGCLVEGFFDVLRLRSYGYAAVAVMGTHLSNFQLQKLARFFNRIVVVPDGDAPGREAAEVWRTKVSDKLRVSVVPMADGKDPDDLSPAEAFELIGPPTELV